MQVEPERHELVTLFFSDIVGFTAMSQALTPEKVYCVGRRSSYKETTSSVLRQI
jgi:hypothetical protein